MSDSTAYRGTMTTDEFLSWDPGDGRTWQLFHGTPRRLQIANRIHAALHAETERIIRDHLRARGGACTVVSSPRVLPHVLKDRNVRIPELAVVRGPGRTIVDDPILVVEVLSPSSRADTRANVWGYLNTPSVQEVVVLHTALMRAELRRRQPDRLWSGGPQHIDEGDLVLDSIGLRVSLADLYRTTPFAAAPPG